MGISPRSRTISPLLMLLFLLLAGFTNCRAGGFGLTPSDLYQQSLNCDRLYSYEGTEFITSFHDDGRSISSVVEVAHLAPDQFRITYRAPSNLAGRVIFEDDGQQWTYLPDRDVLVHSFLSLLASRKSVSAKYMLLKQNFRLEIDSQSQRIAGRKVFALTIQPIKGKASSRKLWIDPYTGIVLRTEQYHPDGSLADVAYFSELTVHPQFSRDEFSQNSVTRLQTRVVEAKDPNEQVVPKPNVARLFGVTTVVPRILGHYHLQSATIMQQQHKILHLRYSDGLASLSLFESLRTSRLATRIPGSRRISIAPDQNGQFLQLYSYNLLSWDTAHLNFTLVGEPRLQFLAKLAQTIPAP